MSELSPYKLTIVAAIVVLILSAGLLGMLGGWQNAAPYLTLVGTVAVPSLLVLLRSESNSKQLTEAHEENKTAISSLDQKINQLRQ
jgi:Na+(H+)/acetate symporter ActP